MILTLFTSLVLCADDPAEKKPAAAGNPEPIPVKVREDFERGDDAKAHMLQSMDDQLKEIDIRIKSIPSVSTKSALTAQRSDVAANLRKLKTQAVKPWMPISPEAGDIGHFTDSSTTYVLDGKMIVVEIQQSKDGPVRSFSSFPTPLAKVLMRGLNNAGYKTGKAIPREELFRVTKIGHSESLPKNVGRVDYEAERIPVGTVNA